jgi:1-acyl-sn-glycerol-3-phosphate acyltransferase
VTGARQALAVLGIAQTAWGLATGCLAALLLPHAPPWAALGWPVAGAALVAALCAGVLGERRARAASAGLCLGVVPLAALLPGAWPWWLALLAAAAVLGGPAYGLALAVTARRARVALPRAVSAFQFAIFLALAAGLIAGHSLRGAGDPLAAPFLAPAALYLVALLGAVSGPAAPSAPVEFLHAGGRLLRDEDTRELLLASALFAAFCLLTGAGVYAPGTAADVGVLAWIALGAAAGSLLAGVPWHPGRVLGVVPLGVTGLAAAGLWGWRGMGPEAHGFWLVAGACGGLAGAALRAGYQAQAPHDAPAGAAAWRDLVAAALIGVALGVVSVLERLGVFGLPQGRAWFLGLLAAAAVPAAWWLFFRQFAEEALADLLGPCYRIRTHGPGLDAFPEQGPVLVLANHAAWFDPLWLGIVLPRQLTPLMISIFYDKPVLHWLMSRVVRAIRVLDTPYRREAPELAEAVAVLDRGGCVLIFPEGVLRRKDELPLRPFGQGVWRILRERPATPVVVCWIEGGWGSMTSHFKGPPLAHKPLDWRRPIDIAVEPPRVLDAAVLADQHATRRYLHQACLEARRHLGLEVPVQVPPDPEPAARLD